MGTRGQVAMCGIHRAGGKRIHQRKCEMGDSEKIPAGHRQHAAQDARVSVGGGKTDGDSQRSKRCTGDFSFVSRRKNIPGNHGKPEQKRNPIHTRKYSFLQRDSIYPAKSSLHRKSGASKNIHPGSNLQKESCQYRAAAKVSG